MLSERTGVAWVESPILITKPLYHWGLFAKSSHLNTKYHMIQDQTE